MSEESLSKHRSSNRKNPKKTRSANLEIPDNIVYFEGWVKYYHYNNDTHYNKPPSLFQNNAFFHQRIAREKLTQKDKYGSLHIPNKASFFMVVYNESISFYSTRVDQVNHLIDSLRISNIRVVPEDDVYNGGIRDDKSFPFGFCIEIVADVPTTYTEKKLPGSGVPETWIVCTAQGQEKDILISTLIKLKVKHQRLENNGMKIMTDDKKQLIKKPPGLGSLIAKPLKEDDSRTGLGDLKDGYWVMLNDWTGCSKKCGNGTSYQQWMCVPPKNGGKPCTGQAIKSKLCNTHACPSVNSLLSLLNVNVDVPGKQKSPRTAEVSPRPIVKVGVFSNRPQRYSKCIIKENDAFIMTIVAGTIEPVKKPMRIMMNNMTISIFNDDNYQELNYSYDLARTKLVIDNTKWCCFTLEDNWRKSNICGYKEYCGAKDKNEWVDGWNNDFTLFKTSCKTTLPETQTLNNVLVIQDIQDEIQKKTSEIMDEVEVNAANEQSIIVKKEVLKQAKRQYQKKKKNAENLSFTVIGKEINLENMVKKEEAKKEEVETKILQEQIAQEEYKAECLEKSFQERELDDEFVESQRESMDDIDEVHQQARKKIQNSRNHLKKTIAQMKTKSRVKNQDLATKLKQIRSKMSKEIMLANKNGNLETCRKAKTNADLKEQYCNENFVDDWSRNADCKSDDFCYICCENEYGAMFVTQRDNCYKMCDGKEKKPEPVPEPSPAKVRELLENPPEEPINDNLGKWVWAPKEKQAPAQP